MKKNTFVKFVTDYVFGDAITPQLPRSARLGAALMAAPAGMVLGAVLCWFGTW